MLRHMPERLELPERGIVGIRADNPGPFSLTGTNSWLLGDGPVWLIDPGPALPPHLDALAAEIAARGGQLGGIALTHDHHDHNEAIPAMRKRFPGAPLAAARGDVDIVLRDGGTFGPLEAMALPGHAPDHFIFLYGDVAFSGDAVLGIGSTIVPPDPGALAGYLAGLERLRMRGPAIICPGHGPLVLDAVAKISEYIEHRLDRERRLLAALDAGRRTVDELVGDAWSDVPEAMRPAAAIAMRAHLDKLDSEGRLPDGVQWPDWDPSWGRAV